jgi:hypothetical protein
MQLDYLRELLEDAEGARDTIEDVFSEVYPVGGSMDEETTMDVIKQAVNKLRTKLHDKELELLEE